MAADVHASETTSAHGLPADVCEALQRALTCFGRGHLDDAEAIYRDVLRREPDQPHALHFLGILCHQRGQGDKAIGLIERSIALKPNEAGWFSNLSSVLIEYGRADEALDACRRAIAVNPDHALAHNNLGALLKARGQISEAETALRRAVALDPKEADFHINLGRILNEQGRSNEALAAYSEALNLNPRRAGLRSMLGLALYANGQFDRAAAMFREWAEEEPDNPIAQHMHAAYSGQRVPPRASDLYIEQTFNAFTASFDAQLGQLDYRAPELVADALARMCGTPLGALHGLDAGCGTGLCGPLIEPFLRRLVGVDLSAGMLDRARRRQVYDELVKAEVTDFLERHPAAYDVVVSTDMLVYFGPLEKVLRAAACALRPDGLLFFTVEEWTDPDRAGYYQPARPVQS
jgi:predicted TPR repeat methyltransferase